MRAEGFGGYQDLKLTDIPSPGLSEGRVLVRMTAAGVTPLDYTILSGQYPMAKAPLVLGNEGAGIVEGGGTAEYPKGARVMFIVPYGALENASWSRSRRNIFALFQTTSMTPPPRVCLLHT